MSEMYYLRNKDAGILCNSWFWYGKAGQGYTAYIQGAERMLEGEADAYIKEDSEKWAKYKCSEIEERLHLIFDSQDQKNLGTDAPCGWVGGYAGENSMLDRIIELENALLLKRQGKPLCQ